MGAENAELPFSPGFSVACACIGSGTWDEGTAAFAFVAVTDGSQEASGSARGQEGVY